MSLPSGSFNPKLAEVAEFVEPPVIYYSKADFVTTKQGNKISRSVQLKGAERITVAGQTIIEAGAELNGDLAPITGTASE